MLTEKGKFMRLKGKQLIDFFQRNYKIIMQVFCRLRFE